MIELMASTTAFDLATAPGHLIRRAQQLHTAIWAEVVDTGLTGVQFAVLAALEVKPDLDQRTLGERISLGTYTDETGDR
jgi:hypothetical protein